MANVLDFEAVAKLKITRSAYDYVAGSVDSEFTLRRNRQAFDWASIVPRAVGDGGLIDLSTSVLGVKMSAPIIVAPTAGHGQMHADGEKATHQGSTAAGALMSVSSNASFPIDEVAKAAKGPLWSQLYAAETQDLTRDRVERALQAGCQAICFTVDVQYSSHRERVLHDRNLNIAPPGPGGQTPRRARGTPPPALPYRLRGQNPDNTWQRVEEIRAYTWLRRDGRIVDRAHWKLLFEPQVPWRRAFPFERKDAVAAGSKHFRELLEVPLFPDALATLDQLGARYTLGVLSNSPTARYALTKLGLASRFAAITMADDPYRKPHRQAFEDACTALDSTADTTIYVGDSFANDIEGALDAGLRAVWVDRFGDGHPLPFGAWRVDRLSKLPDVIESFA